MQKIQVLSDEVVFLLRSGEVVQRPVNVVKELLENSIDSGATNIIVKIEGGGKKLIEVSDNGCGMSLEDAQICILPHATSKVKTKEDLFAIKSLGFRGEALHSISTVSILEIKTKEHGSDIGCSISNFGGQLTHRMVGCTEGTHTSVKALFYNTPARKAAMKTDASETLAITKLVTRYMLLKPNIGFQYYVNGTVHLIQRSDMSESSMLSSILGSDIARGMKPVDYSVEGVIVKGFASTPNVVKKNSDGIILGINGRYVEEIDPYIKTIRDAYRRSIQTHDFPIVVLRIEIDPSKIDPNIHPQKSKVEVLDPELFKRILFESILSCQRYLKGCSTEGVLCPDNSLSANSALLVQEEPSVNNVFVNPEETDIVGTFVDYPQQEVKEVEKKESKGLPQMEVVGQCRKMYIISVSDDYLFLIDQHALHEKQLFEEIYKKSVIDTFRPVSPYILNLRLEDSDMLASSLDLFAENGLEIDRLDATTWKCYQMPSVNGVPIPEQDIINLVRDTIGNLADKPSLDDFRRKMIAEVACKSAIRANEMLSVSEMSRLLEAGRYMDDPWFCPHGRPTTKVFRSGTVDKWFKR